MFPGRSGDSTARLWRLEEGGAGHTPSIVLPHQPVDSASQECNRDVTTVHWNVRGGRVGGWEGGESEGERRESGRV